MESGPPAIFRLIWSTSVAGAPQCRHNGSRLKTIKRNRCHSRPYPRALELGRQSSRLGGFDPSGFAMISGRPGGRWLGIRLGISES